MIFKNMRFNTMSVNKTRDGSNGQTGEDVPLHVVGVVNNEQDSVRKKTRMVFGWMLQNWSDNHANARNWFSLLLITHDSYLSWITFYLGSFDFKKTELWWKGVTEETRTCNDDCCPVLHTCNPNANGNNCINDNDFSGKIFHDHCENFQIPIAFKWNIKLGARSFSKTVPWVADRKHTQLNEDACAGKILEFCFIAMARHHKIVSEALISV